MRVLHHTTLMTFLILVVMVPLDSRGANVAPTEKTLIFRSFFSILYMLGVLGAVSATTSVYAAAKSTPNILFIIKDDVGVDQMKVFEYGGADPAKTHTIDVYSGSQKCQPIS